MAYLLLFTTLLFAALFIFMIVKLKKGAKGEKTFNAELANSLNRESDRLLRWVNTKAIRIFRAIWKRKIRFTFLFLGLILFFYIKGIFADEKIWVNVPPGHRGVVFNRFGGGMKDKMMGEGSSFYMPFLQSVYIADLTRSSARINQITADSHEFQDVVLDINVEFSLQEESLLSMYRKYGMKSSAEVVRDIIEPNANEAVKNIVINYPIFEVLLAQSEIKKELYKQLENILGEYYITLYDVDIENILIASKFRNTVAEAELARAGKERENILLEQTRLQSERLVLEAENSKKVKILEAESIAEYNRLVSRQTINQNVLELKRLENKAKAIEKWDGKLPSETGALNNWPFD